MISFLVLSLLSGVIELGGIYLGITWDLPNHSIIMLPLFYQVGNLLTSILPSKTSGSIAVIGTVCLLCGIYNWHPSFWILAVQLALCSYCIQIVRLQNKSVCATWLKRSFRIAGFALSPIMCLKDGQAVILLSIMLCVFSLVKEVLFQKVGNESSPRKEHRPAKISMVMVFHQLHYFVYTYIIPIYVHQKTGSIAISALLFSLSWVIYLAPQTIAEKLHIVHYKTMFFCCHIFLGLCMAAISISAHFDSMGMVLLFWLLTGFGGGSVFCISHLYKRYASINIDFSENIGHFLGPVIAIFLCHGADGNIFAILPAVSCLFVMMTLLFALYVIRKEGKHYEK